MEEMSESEETIEISPRMIKQLGVMGLIVLMMTGVIFVAQQYSKKRQGDIILPGGITYLGPPATPMPTPTPTPKILQYTAGQLFTATSDTKWETYTSKAYKYTFSHPITLPLSIFVLDPLDSVAIDWGGIPPQQNILISVDDLTTNTMERPYVGNPRGYVENWWRQFPGLKGFASITNFTNVKGLSGYKTKYINQNDKTPNDDIFFAVPGRPELMIRIANGILESSVFTRIVDSVSWPTSH